MFSYIQGSLSVKEFPIVVVDVNGIGYELSVSINTIEQLPEIGAHSKLLTHFYVREDAQVLYGFINEEERTLFRMLLKVSGFGAKVAISILSRMSPAEFVSIIVNKDKQSLTELPGIGQKSADRLIIELSDKVGELDIAESKDFGTFGRNIKDAEEALHKLGYKPSEARKALALVDNKENITVMIRQALRHLARS